MGIKTEQFNSLAIKGDVSGVAISTIVALNAIANALVDLQAGRDAAKNIEELRTAISALDQQFTLLTGWTPDP